MVYMKKKKEDKSATLSAYEKITKKLLSNQLDSKKSLDEKIFSKEFHMSRTPIREALIMLEKENLVSRDEGRGFYIKQFTMKEIQDMFVFRYLLEAMAANLILAKINEGNTEELSKISKQTRSLIAKKDEAGAIAKSFEFHEKFIEICENEAIIEALKNCYKKLTLIGCTKYILAGDQSCKEHDEILSALKKRDLKQLKAKVQRHISAARNRAINILKDDLDRWYFSP